MEKNEAPTADSMMGYKALKTIAAAHIFTLRRYAITPEITSQKMHIQVRKALLLKGEGISPKQADSPFYFTCILTRLRLRSATE